MRSDTPNLPDSVQERPIPNDEFAKSLRGFGLPGIMSILVIIITGNVFISQILMIPAGAILVFLWAWRSHTPWYEIGYKKPASWTVSVFAGTTLGILFKLLMKIIVLPLLGADPINHTYHFLAGNTAMLPGAILTMLLAGLGEETVYRGFLFERLGKHFKPGISSRIFTILLTTSLFALMHYDQGIYGIEQAVATGLVFGTLYSATGIIWTVIFAHAAFDLTALVIIYCNLETTFAHLVFK